MFDRVDFGSESRVSCCWCPFKSVLNFRHKCSSIYSCSRTGNWFLWAKIEADWMVSLYKTAEQLITRIIIIYNKAYSIWQRSSPFYSEHAGHHITQWWELWRTNTCHITAAQALVFVPLVIISDPSSAWLRKICSKVIVKIPSTVYRKEGNL